MAKSGSGKLVSPLYSSGKTNGAVGGPKGGLSVPDPRGALNKTGLPAPGSKK